MNPIERFHISIQRQEGGPAILLTKASAKPSPADEKELTSRARAINFPTNGYVSPLNLFFHHLPSGASALGRLLPSGPYGAGEPFSPRAYSVEYLLIPPDVMRRFANNPTLLFQTLLENGQIAPFAGGLPVASPVEMVIPDTQLDEALLDGLAVAPGSGPLAFLLQSVLDSIVTCFTGTPSPLHLLSALFTLLPVDWRPELTFTLGVPFSEEFPWRLVFLPAAMVSSTVSQGGKSTEGPVVPKGVPIINLEELARASSPPDVIDGWPLFIREVLEQGEYQFLQNCYETEFPNKGKEDDFAGQRTTVEDINHIGFSSLFELKHVTGKGLSGERMLFSQLTGRKAEQLDAVINTMRIEHEQPLALEVGDGRILSPYQQLVASWPSRDTELLRFDSLLAHALDGDFGALETLRKIWNSLVTSGEESLFWMIREEYAHYIQSYLLCESERSESRSVNKSFHALEILEMLFEKAVRRPE
ncbi:MAG: hypothetical protein Q4G68_11115 [Planctomycetia bacterium]|nr:hypothetical protein [Planctomycetia bacterium]